MLTFMVLSSCETFNLKLREPSTTNDIFDMSAVLEVSGRFVRMSSDKTEITSYCSGVLISPTLILTASHCLFLSQDAQKFNYTISFQLPNSTMPEVNNKAFRIKKIISNQNYDYEALQIAIKENNVSKYFDLMKYDFSFVEIEADSNLTNLKFPLLALGQQNQILKNAVYNDFIVTGVAHNNLGSIDIFRCTFEEEQGDIYEFSKCPISEGVSGGPLFVRNRKISSNFYLMGVASGGARDYKGRPKAYIVRYDSDRQKEIKLTKWNKFLKLKKDYLGQ